MLSIGSIWTATLRLIDVNSSVVGARLGVVWINVTSGRKTSQVIYRFWRTKSFKGNKSLSFLRIFRPAPRAVQDELALLLYGRMVVLVPFLYIGIAATAITVGVLADSGLPFILAFGLPGLILGFSFARMIVWMRRKTAQVTAAHAACRLNGSQR